MTQVEIIKYRGYPVEVHHVISDDGYVLELHRIPSGHPGFHPGGRPVLLQHGILGTDANWLTNPTDQALGISNLIAQLLFNNYQHFKRLQKSVSDAVPSDIKVKRILPKKILSCQLLL